MGEDDPWIVRISVKYNSNAEFFSLTEKDKNGDVLWTWSFPTIDSTLRELIMRKSTLSTVGDGNSEVEPLSFVFGHYDTSWYYLYNSSFENHPQVLFYCSYE